MTRLLRRVAACLMAVVVLRLAEPSALVAQGQSGSFEPLTLQADRAYFSQLPFESIDAVSGNLVLSFTDLVLQGNGGMGIAVGRSMNYGAANGPAWTIAPAGIPIALEGVTAPASGPWVVGVITGDRGRRRVPHQAGVDTYVLDNFMRVTLSTRTVEMPNGWVATYESTAGIQEAHLQEVHDAWGNSITATWLPRPVGGVTATNISQLVLQGGGDAARTVFFTYNAAGTELQQLQSEGRTWTYAWSAGKLTSATPPAGPAWQFSYGASDLTVTTPNGGTSSYQFQMLDDGQGHLHPAVTSRSLGGRDVPAGTWTFEYHRNVNPMITIVNSPDGRHLGFRHQATTDPTGGTYWKLVQKTLHRGQTLVSRLDLTYVNCGDGFEPMVNDQVVTQDGRTYTTTLQYNGVGSQRCDLHRPKQITQTGDLTRTKVQTFVYPSQIYRTDLISGTTVTSGGQSLSTSYAYNAQGFLTSETTLGVQTTYAPSSAGNLASVTNAHNQTTGFTYQWGAVKDTQTPLYTISRTINSSGTVASETRRGVQTSLTYDDLGRVVTVSAPGIDTITTAYQPEAVTVTQGASVVTTEVDGFGRTRRTSNNIGVSSTTVYDAEGRVISQTAPSDTTATAHDTFAYDDLGRVTNVTHSGGGTVTTTYSGTTVTVTDENNKTTTQHLALFGPGDGRLTSVVDPANQTWQYGYNGFGSLTSVLQPGGSTRTFIYDAWNRLASETHPESGSTSYTYNDLGQLVTKQDARGTVFTSTYDANGRLTGITGLGSDSVTMGYDASDNRTSLSNGTVASTFAYDAANRVTSRSDVIGGATFTTGYTYDGRGNLTRVTYPSGRMINYAYDAGNRVTQVSDGGGPVYASGLSYHPAGALRTLTFGNGTAETATFDARYRLGQLTSGPLGVTYAFDPGGNVTSIADTRPEMNASFSYDSLDRLRFVTGFGANEYQYDPLGNRTWEANGNVTSTYTSNLRLSQTSGTFGSASYTHDNGGNLQTAGSDTFQYTPFNRLQAATVGGVQSGYSYDGDQQRVIRTGPGGTTYSIRGAGSHVLAEYEVAGGGAVLVREYVYLGAKLVASIGRPNGAGPTATVALTSPTQGATFTEGSTVTLIAQPTVSSGTVARVEFYSHGWFLGEDTTAPYSLDYPWFSSAQHALVARVVTTAGVVASSSVVVITVAPANGAPLVSLTAPANNAVLGTGRTAALTATASDSHGIAQVEFYRGTTLLGTDTSAPYSFDWVNLPNGVYTLTAKAYDTLGVTTTSAPVTLTVQPIATVTVNPAWPTAGTAALVTIDGASFCTGVTVTFGDGQSDTLVNSGGLPITTTHSWATPGPKTVTAQGLGAACESSAAASIIVLTPPTVTLTSPAHGSQYVSPATIELAASATPGQGAMSAVHLYANGGWVFSDSAAPFAYTWTGMANGTYSLTAVAVDNWGGTATSSSVSVTVGDPQPSTVHSVTVTPNPATAGQSATITVTGSNPCTMLHMDFGDGDWWIAPISGLPFTTTKTWTTLGTYTVFAAGYLTCGGEATRVVTVNAAAPEPLPLSTLTPGDNSLSFLADLPFALAAPSFTADSTEHDELGDELDATTPAPRPSSAARDGSARPKALPDVTVYIDINGTGSGSVSGSASCSGASMSCAVVTAQSSVLTLTATPHAGMTFTGWTGACWHSNPTCTVDAWEHRFVAANFTAATSMVTSYYHLDSLGSVRALTDAAGTVMERHDYRPFGEDTMPLPAPGSDPARYLGQHRDSTKLDQFGARYYSMFHGRFTAVDPGNADATLASPQSWNAYAYGRNNPLRFTDPSGLSALPTLPIFWPGYNDTITVPGVMPSPVSLLIWGDPFFTNASPWLGQIGNKGRAPGFQRGGPPAAPTVSDPTSPATPQQETTATPEALRNQAGDTPTASCSPPAGDRSLGYDLADAVTGMGDAFLLPIYVRDWFDLNGAIDFESSWYKGGKVLGTAIGAAPLVLSGAAFAGGTAWGKSIFNANRYFRIGPGRWGGELNVPRISSPYLKPLTAAANNGHIRLSSRLGPGVPPAGALANPCSNRKQ